MSIHVDCKRRKSLAKDAHRNSPLLALQVVPLPMMKGLPAELPFHAILAAGTESGGGGDAAGYSELRSLPYQCSAARLQPDRCILSQHPLL